MAAGTQLDRAGGEAAGMQPPGRGQSGFALPGEAGRLWQQAGNGWRGMEPGRRRAVAVGAALTALVLGLLLWAGARTDWKTLYQGLDTDDARQVSETLTTAQIPFDLAAGGTTIRVPAGLLDKARLATAAKGGTHSGRMGFELFDKPNWIGSEFDEQVNYQRALEGELEHTIATLSDVKSARVHLVMPHDSLFRDQDRPAKAAVVLALRHAGLADGEDEAIRNLVASAVDGLAPAQVSLIDASGHLPLGAKTPGAQKLTEEQALEAKIIETLEPVTGQGNVRASVTMDDDPVAIDQTEETYDPTKTVTLQLERTQQSAGSQPVAAGVPGTASNAPNAQAKPPVYPPQTTSPQSATSESGTYGVSRTVRHTTEAAGHLRRLTAAVVVNDRLLSPATRSGAAKWQPRSAEELRNLTALAQAAVGFDSSRGDVVTVADLAFNDNRAVPGSPASELLAAAERSPLLLQYGAALGGLLLVILLVLRPALRPALRSAAPGKANRSGKAGKGGGAPSAAELAAGVSAPALAPRTPTEADRERERVQAVFEQVTEQVRQNPAQSSRLLQSWIHSD